MRPRIALNCDVVGEARRKATIPLAYVDYVFEAGGDPHLRPPLPGRDEDFEGVDGVLLIGGDDYRVANQHGEPADFVPIDPRRERYDLELAGAALRRDLPTFGICAGFQALALVVGGEIHGDLPTENPGPVQHKAGASPSGDAPSNLVSHRIDWIAWSGLAIPAGDHEVNSAHHQAVARLPADWQVLARAADGVIEAAAGPGAFQLGVQWHPEREPGTPVNTALIEGFLEAARRYRREGGAGLA